MFVPAHSGSNFGSVRSRKENRSEDSPAGGNEMTLSNDGTRKVAQGFSTMSSGTKRQRTVTPAPFKPIDEEDEARSSPTTRKMAHGKAEAEVERRVLSGRENVR